MEIQKVLASDLVVLDAPVWRCSTRYRWHLEFTEYLPPARSRRCSCWATSWGLCGFRDGAWAVASLNREKAGLLLRQAQAIATASRVPTTFVQKYTPRRAQLKPSGAPEPASGRGRPAAAGDRRGSVRKKRTFWPNSSAAWNMTRVPCSVSVRQNARNLHSMDRPSTAAKHDPPHRTTFIEERRTARRKLMSVPSSAATTRSSGNSRGSVGRWVFAEVERDLISGAHPGGALPRGQVGGSDHATDRIDRGPAVQLRCEDGPRESRRRLAHHLPAVRFIVVVGVRGGRRPRPRAEA